MIEFSADKMIKKLSGISQRVNNMTPIMKVVAMQMKNQIQDNIKGGYSYLGEDWERSKSAIKRNGKTLQNTSRLVNSMSAQSGNNFAVAGTNVVYARTLNNGAKKGEFGIKDITVREHTRKIKGKTVNIKSHTRHNVPLPFGNIKAYKFIGMSEEDKKQYMKQIQKYILEED